MTEATMTETATTLPPLCASCAAFFDRFTCSRHLGECDCPKCQGLCSCATADTGLGADATGLPALALQVFTTVPPLQPPRTFRELMIEAFRLDELLTARDGEILPEEEPLAEALAAGILKKVDGCGDYLEGLQREIDAFKDEEERLAARRKALTARRERFVRYLHHTMTALNVPKAEGSLYALVVRKNPPSVVVDDEDALPAKFLIYTMEKRVDKKALGAALKAGPVPGARLEAGTSLQVRV